MQFSIEHRALSVEQSLSAEKIFVGTIINRPPESRTPPYPVWGKRNTSYGEKYKPATHVDFLTPRKGAFENQSDDS